MNYYIIVNTAGYVLRWLDREIIPAIGTVPITQINAQHVIKMIRAVEARQANDVARRIKSVCGQVFRYAIVEGLYDESQEGMNTITESWREMGQVKHLSGTQTTSTLAALPQSGCRVTAGETVAS